LTPYGPLMRAMINFSTSLISLVSTSESKH
jgi:hypothetical protein